jgi:tRNA G37 N-methylase Trm5
LSLVKDKGTIFHYEGIVENDNYIALFGEFNEIALKRGYKCELNSYRFVKSYGPRLFHTVLDILVTKI